MSEEPIHRPTLVKRKGGLLRKSVAVFEESDSTDEEHGGGTGGTAEPHSPPGVPGSSGSITTARTTTSTARQPARTVQWTRVARSQPPVAEAEETDASLLFPEIKGPEWLHLGLTPERTLVLNLLARFDQDLAETVGAAKVALASGDDGGAKVALRKAIRIAEGYAAQTATTMAQWRARADQAGTAAIPYGQDIIATLNQKKNGYRNVLHSRWSGEYPPLAWQDLTEARISGQGATGVVFGFEADQIRAVLKATATDPLGELLLANLLHKECSQAFTVSTFDVSIDRDAISQSVLSQLQSDPPNRTDADVQTMKDEFAKPANTVFSFGVAQGRDLKTLAQTQKAALDDVMTGDRTKAQKFWKKLGQIVAVDRFLGIDDRATTRGSNVGNIILGAEPDAITVIDNYDSNTQGRIALDPSIHTALLDAFKPPKPGDTAKVANIDNTARLIVSDVRRMVEFEAPGAVVQKQDFYEDPELAGYLKTGIEQAIGLLVIKLIGVRNESARLQSAVESIQQADVESSGKAQPSPGLDWAAITARVGYLNQTAKIV
jgi:hypothetical protein